jgi:hypothetical protein
VLDLSMGLAILLKISAGQFELETGVMERWIME